MFGMFKIMKGESLYMSERAIQLNAIGCKYLNEKDYINAYKYFVESAELGDINAIYNVGYCYFNGFGVSKNYEKAFRLLSRFVDTKSNLAVSATYLCGIMLDDGGYGIKSNKKQAADYYVKSAEQGHSWSMFMLGRLAHINSEYDTSKSLFETVLETETEDYELRQKCKKFINLIKLEKFF